MRNHKKIGAGRQRGGVLRAALIAVLAMQAPAALQAAELGEETQFDITAQSLDTALLAFSRQAGIQILATTQTLAGKTTAGVKGQLVVEQALAALLRGSGLKYRQTSSHAVTVELAESSETSALNAAGTVRLAQAETGTAESASRYDENISEVLVSARKPFTEGNMDIVRTENDAQPYQIIGKDEIEKSGAANVEDFLKKHLTMNAVARNPGLAAVSTVGTMSNVNLRGIGTNQTLILINGRRTATIALFGATNQPDVNSVPIGAVERIEVLPVSSSAIYGGSAIGGVINVVLKRNYEGGQVNLSYRSPFDVDAPIRTVDATYGLSLEGGRTHLMVGARYSDSEAPLARDRPELYGRGLATVLRNNPAVLTSPAAPFTPGTLPNIGSVNGGNLTLRPEYGGGSLGSNITHLPAGVTSATSPLAIGAGLQANAGTYDFSRVDSVGGTTGQGLRAPVHGMPEAKSFIATARRQMTEDIEAFVELYNSTNLRSAYWMPASAAYVVSAASPFNPFQQDVRVTLPALGERSEIWSENEVTRATAGMLIELPKDWQMETDYTWTRNVNRQGSAQFYSSSLPPAMFTGAVNPFVDARESQLDLAPYRGNAWGRFPSSLDNIALRAAGPLWQLPAGSPTLAIGLERRKESMDQGPYVWNYPTRPIYSLNRTYRSQSQTVLSAYAELKLPLVSGANSVPLVRELDLQLAGRTEHFKVSTGTSYSDAGLNAAITSSEITYSSTNPTIGLRYKPFDGIMLRASYATGFLPPDFGQFMEPILGGGDSTGPNATRNVIDPRRGNQVTAVNFIAGGNPDIEPQNSTSWSVGLVWEPTFAEGLRASVDWYRLKLQDVAVTPTPQQIVNLEHLYPNRVRRGAASPGDPFGVGQLTLVDFSLLNANEMFTEGVDFTLSYRFGAGALGNFQLAAMGTTIRSFERQTAIGTPLVDVVNDVADTGPLKHKGNLAATWVRGAWKADWIVSYFGSYNQYDTGGLTTYVLAQGSRTVPSQTYHDAVLEYRWPDSQQGALSDRLLSGTTAQLGISNVFDKTPPFDAFYNFNNYISPFGDARLREFWVSVTKRF